MVDGTDPELVRRIMETELENMMTRHDNNKRLFDEWANYAPAFGMIGTLMGLILMLVNLEDKSTIGPYMAVALITTLYGASWQTLSSFHVDETRSAYREEVC